VKISELAQRTNVSKQTIHHYIREGVLRKPKKKSTNSVDYSESYVRQILIIKNLQEDYFLPLSAIKKILQKLKTKTELEKSVFEYMTEFLQPLDRLLLTEVVGKKNFIEATGISEKWLGIMEEWEVISSCQKNGEAYYDQDDVIIGRAVVEMGRLGFGAKEGYKVGDLREIVEFLRQFVEVGHQDHYQLMAENMTTQERIEKTYMWVEMMCLLFYHSYRKRIRNKFASILLEIQTKQTQPVEKADVK
jgi:DNA-binding transcriptional MerR regulator